MTSSTNPSLSLSLSVEINAQNLRRFLSPSMVCTCLLTSSPITANSFPSSDRDPSDLTPHSTIQRVNFPLQTIASWKS